MYSYTWDEETGGLILHKSELKFSKEPRPVYSEELDILGFNKYWKYEKNDTLPLMWAEANNYIYKGRIIGQAKGGSLKVKPTIIVLDDPEPDGSIIPVNVELMCQKNQELLEQWSQESIKKIFEIFEKFQKKIDVFYVAFSGGKDSIVTLDLVQRTLPHNSFKVLFGDTGMEFPDTYETVDKTQEFCISNGIEFIRSHSHLVPEDSWKCFGPPATVNRWCCSVHKTSPQILSLRKITGKSNFTGLAFIGVRASESIARSEYDYISLGEKHKGQYSCNPILEWNSAELFLYMYSRKLYINNAYKKGNRRAGCLVCPRAAERSDYFARNNYTESFDKLISSIRYSYSENFTSNVQLDQFIVNGGWKARKNGRDINIASNYNETIENGLLVLTIRQVRTNWKEWIKTIGVLSTTSSPYDIVHKGKCYTFNLTESEEGLIVTIDADLIKREATFIKLFKNVFRKCSSCILCKVCEADCHNGCLHMDNGQLHIDDNCFHCSQCHKVEKGCLIYKSIEKPKGINSMNIKNQSLNCYSHHAPKLDWFTQFFKYKNEFSQNHSLGTNMYDFFKRFLKDAGLTEGNSVSDFALVLDELTLDSESTWALMLSNLVYTPQFNWFVRRIGFNDVATKEYVLNSLIEDGAKESWVSDIWSSFSRISDLPFAHVGFGNMIKEGKKSIALARIPWVNIDEKVILYSLYKFAEACGGFYQFTLNRLMDNDVDSDGVGPNKIFGIDNETLTQILKGLAVNYPDFINVSFTLDLDNITLKEDKSSKDVLSLF